MNHYGSHGVGFNHKGPESFVSRNAIETFLNHFPTIRLDDSSRRGQDCVLSRELVSLFGVSVFR